MPIPGETIKNSILLISGLSPDGVTKAIKLVSFMGINAWLPKGCFSIMSIFIGKVLFKAEKILTIVFPSSFEVLIYAKLSKRFAYPAFIFIGLILSEEIKSAAVNAADFF